MGMRYTKNDKDLPQLLAVRERALAVFQLKGDCSKPELPL